MNHTYPPEDWNGRDVAAAVTDSPPPSSIPRYSETERWDRIQSGALTGPWCQQIRKFAGSADQLPQLTATKFLDFERTGSRRAYQADEVKRLSQLGRLVVAECLEREGEHLDAALDRIWAIAEQTTWTLPAHRHMGAGEAYDEDGLLVRVPPEERFVGLHAARYGHMLAEIDHILGEQLHPGARRRIRQEVEDRVFVPYRAQEFWYQEPPEQSNWNAVCNASVCCAALYLLDDEDRLGRILERGLDALRYYLNYFDADGCTSEGIHYWNYGFRHFVHLWDLLADATGGAYDLGEVPVTREIARFPYEIETSPGSYVAFADATPETGLYPYLGAWLGDRLEDRGLVERGVDAARTGHHSVCHDRPLAMFRSLAWMADLEGHDEITAVADERSFFPDSQWYIGRATDHQPVLVVAAKGGQNVPPHNHNDCGNVVVHYDGDSQVAELGQPVYDAEYLHHDGGETNRYEYTAARSLGHSVPYVNGEEQVEGEGHTVDLRDVEFGDARDRVVLELADCYPPAAAVESLERTVTLRRGPEPSVTVADTATFAAPTDNTFESVLITRAEPDVGEDAVRLHPESAPVEVRPEPAATAVAVDHVPNALNLSDHTKREDDVSSAWRLRFGTLEEPVDAEQYSLSLTFVPERGSEGETARTAVAGDSDGH